MQASISFRMLGRSDFPLLQEWLSVPHVATWWGNPPDLGTVNKKYGRLVDGTQPTHVFVIERGRQPVGWIQWYLWSDYQEHATQLAAEPFSAGIDLAIGELGMTGLGLGPVAIREFLWQVVFARAGIDAVITDPAEANLRSLRAFEKAGFRVMKKVQLAGETFERLVLRVDRTSLKPGVCKSQPVGITEMI